MISILFFEEGAPDRSLLAAAFAKSYSIPGFDVRIDVAGEYPDQLNEYSKEIITKSKLQLPDTVLSPSQLDIYQYDLLITFKGSDERFAHALISTSNLRWKVPSIDFTGSPDEIRNSFKLVAKIISNLIQDLYNQGYLLALFQSTANSQLIMENLNVGLIARDINKRIFFVNRTTEEITGYPRDELIGKDCHNAFSGQFCDPSTGNTQDQEEEPPSPCRFTHEFRTKSGDTKRLDMCTLPMKNMQGNVMGMLASFLDVTREFDMAKRLGEIEQFSGIVGRDAKLTEIFQLIRDLADCSAPVLIQGESGTGKELVAVSIHNEGPRAANRFVPINCGALPEYLLESELFGHVKGSFTGAIRDKKGKFEQADGGTIFLDEIGDISQAMQVKLLRILQDGKLQRVGGEDTLNVNVRIISATNKDLRHQIEINKFREDLFYRLCVVPITLPPLRDRRNDIPLLTEHFLKKHLSPDKRSEKFGLSEEAMNILMAYDWPGNIRELQNAIQFCLVLCRSGMIMSHHLPPNILENSTIKYKMLNEEKKRGKLDFIAVTNALQETNNNRVEAAKRLGVSRATLYRFLAKHPISK
jgi:sigma-54 dependent transcriptional regulator, acetoin dehydrogenase operon transcriptional activator AcoR